MGRRTKDSTLLYDRIGYQPHEREKQDSMEAYPGRYVSLADVP